MYRVIFSYLVSLRHVCTPLVMLLLYIVLVTNVVETAPLISTLLISITISAVGLSQSHNNFYLNDK